MSISDGIVLSTFCREMKKTLPLVDEMDGKGVYFPLELAFPNWFLLMQILFPICTLIWRANNYVCRPERLWRGKMKVRRDTNYILMIVTGICTSGNMTERFFQQLVKNSDWISVKVLLYIVPRKMATLRIKRKPADLIKQNWGEHLRSKLAQTQMTPDQKRNISLNSLRKLRMEWKSNCLRSSVGRKTGF